MQAHEAEVEKLMPRVKDVINSYLQALDEADIDRPAAMTRMRSHLLRRMKIVLGEVQLSGDGKAYVMDVEVPPGEIAARLAAIASERRGDQVFLRADQGLAYGRIVGLRTWWWSRPSADGSTPRPRRIAAG